MPAKPESGVASKSDRPQTPFDPQSGTIVFRGVVHLHSSTTVKLTLLWTVVYHQKKLLPEGASFPSRKPGFSRVSQRCKIAIPAFCSGGGLFPLIRPCPAKQKRMEMVGATGFE